MYERIKELAKKVEHNLTQAGYNIKELDAQDQMIAEKYAARLYKEYASHGVEYENAAEGLVVLFWAELGMNHLTITELKNERTN
jgi:phosphotransacetylase